MCSYPLDMTSGSKSLSQSHSLTHSIFADQFCKRDTRQKWETEVLDTAINNWVRHYKSLVTGLRGCHRQQASFSSQPLTSLVQNARIVPFEMKKVAYGNTVILRPKLHHQSLVATYSTDNDIVVFKASQTMGLWVKCLFQEQNEWPHMIFYGRIFIGTAVLFKF